MMNDSGVKSSSAALGVLLPMPQYLVGIQEVILRMEEAWGHGMPDTAALPPQCYR